jgi:hypothetical protein
MKKIGIAVLIILLMSGAGYYYYTTTPTYSILQIKKSVDTHDVVLFQKHVDIDTLYTRLIDDVMSAQMAKMAGESDGHGWEKMGAAIGAGMIQMMKPTLISSLKNSTLQYVETGNAKAAEDSKPDGSVPEAGLGKEKANLDGMMKNFGLKDKKSLDYKIIKQGKVATVVVPYDNEELDMPMEMQFTLRDQGGYWQLVQFNNAGELITKVEQEKEKKLTAANAEIQKKMRDMIGFVSAEKLNRTEDQWGYDKKVLIQIVFQSGSNVPVKEWNGEIYVLDKADALVFTLKAKGAFEKPLAKGTQEAMGWEVDINQFMDGHLPLWQLPEGKLNVRMKTARLILEDGSIIEELSSYSQIKK